MYDSDLLLHTKGKSCKLTRYSDKLARCAAEGNSCLPTMAEISQLPEINTA